MTGAVSSAAAARWKDSPCAASQSHMLSMTSPGTSPGTGSPEDIEDGADDVVHEGLAGDCTGCPARCAACRLRRLRPRTGTRCLRPPAASPRAPRAAACVSATMSALKSSRASIGKDRLVGSLTSWPAMRARPSRAFGVSTAASQPASIDDVSGMSSGMVRTPSSAAPESPLPAHASSAIERAWKSMTFTGDASPLTAATASPVTGSTTSMPAEASRSTVAATDSSPNSVRPDGRHRVERGLVGGQDSRAGQGSRREKRGLAGETRERHPAERPRHERVRSGRPRRRRGPGWRPRCPPRPP